MVIHSGLNVVRCMLCLRHFGSGNIRGHLGAHNFSTDPGAIEAALKVCDSLHIPRENKHCSVPSPGGPPVEGLKCGLGFTCLQAECPYAVTVEKNMQSHQSKKHPDLPSSYRQTFVQTLYTVPTRIFHVNPGLEDDHSPDLTAHLQRHILPPALEPPPILLADDDRGRTALENHFRFDLILGPIRESRTSLGLLSELKQRHTKEEEGGIYQTLQKTIAAWHANITRDLNGNPNQLDLERFMIHGDRVPSVESVPSFSHL